MQRRLFVIENISARIGIFILLHRGKMVLGYNEVELCMKGSGYNFIHAADMMYCADNHIRSTSESFRNLRFASKGLITDD